MDELFQTEPFAAEDRTLKKLGQSEVLRCFII